jgi:hypothetical protein
LQRNCKIFFVYSSLKCNAADLNLVQVMPVIFLIYLLVTLLSFTQIKYTASQNIAPTSQGFVPNCLILLNLYTNIQI